MRRTNPTTPVSPRAIEIGLMTVDEFLHARNPGDKMHSAEAYDWDVAGMNKPFAAFSARMRGYSGSGRSSPELIRYAAGDVIQDNGAPLAVLLDGTLYHEKHRRGGWQGWNPATVNLDYHDGRGASDRQDSWQTLPVTRRQTVKYLAEYVERAQGTAKERSLAAYPYLLRRMTVAGEPMQLRAETKPVPDKGTSLALVNEAGQRVALAQDEWGATLIIVAKEYRGHHLGMVLGDAWYELNPKYTSGGFTPQGQASALRIWEARVRELAALGWYSSMVKAGELTKARLAKIMAGLKKRRRAPSILPEPKAPSTKKSLADRVRIWVEPGSFFVIYDADALDVEHAGEIADKHVFAHGFFRESKPVGSYLFAIDYDRPFAALATKVALQMARDENAPIYVGKGYGDFLELDGIEGLVREGDYVHLDHDSLDLPAFARVEAGLRKKADRYGEKGQMLLEIANTKWA